MPKTESWGQWDQVKGFASFQVSDDKGLHEGKSSGAGGGSLDEWDVRDKANGQCCDLGGGEGLDNSVQVFSLGRRRLQGAQT